MPKVSKNSHKKDSKTLDSYDVIIVFGEGPVKPVLLADELSAEQQLIWNKHRNDPEHSPDPGFWCMEQRKQLMEMQKIQESADAPEDKKRHIEALRLRWQHDGWFALRPWGKQNALAAGYALYKGFAKKAILSGGRTISAWVKKSYPESLLDHWPSEAELMADLIRQSYGELYLKKYGVPINEVLLIEDSSTNTLENFAFTVNNHPWLITDEIRIGLLTSEHHLRRVNLLADLFSIGKSRKKQSAQMLIKQIDEETTGLLVQDIISFVREKRNDDREKMETNEERWIKGLIDPQYLTYWLGYIGLVNHTVVVNNALKRLQDPLWHDAAKTAFEKLGLNFDEYEREDLTVLSKKNPIKYNLLIQALRKLRSPHHRNLPPGN